MTSVHCSWAIYGSSRGDIPRIQRATDCLLEGYSFYPEIEWPEYGYGPPQGHQVLGAWRHPRTRLFAFLLDNPRMKTIKPTIQLILYVAGEPAEVSAVERKLTVLKSSLALEATRVEVDSLLARRLERIDESKHFAVLAGVLTVLTAVINAFSLYLRQLPPPDLEGRLLVGAYATLVVSVHFAALTLLLLVVLIVGAFLVKYGVLLIRSL